MILDVIEILDVREVREVIEAIKVLDVTRAVNIAEAGSSRKLLGTKALNI